MELHVEMEPKTAMVRRAADTHFSVKNRAGSQSLLGRRVYRINPRSALKEYAVNPSFRNALATGRFVYVESCFCVIDAKYVCSRDDGTQHLTVYARRHPDECCLAFQPRASANPAGRTNWHEPMVLFRTSSDTKPGKLGYEPALNMTTVESARALGRHANEIAGIKRKLPNDLGETLVAHMERLKINGEQLADSLVVAPKTVQRVLNNDGYSVKLPTVVGMAVALHLDPILGLDLVNKAGYNFRSTKEHMLLEMILNACYKLSIYECNNILRANGCQLLTNEK